MPYATKAARKAYHTRWAREINPVARKDAWRRYAKAHQDENTKSHIRRAKQSRARSWALSSGRCFFCAAALDEASFTVDHRVPRSRGGVDDERNRVAACRRCNARKGNKTASEYRAWLRARGELPPALPDADGLPDWSLDEWDAERALGLE